MDTRPLLQTSALLLCLGALAYFGYGSFQSADNDQGFSSNAPDYIADGINGWNTNLNGVRDRTMQANRVVHYPTPERFTMDRPEMRFTDSKNNPWVVSSLSASGTDPNTDTWLHDTVQATRTTTDGAFTLSTQRLHINARSNIVQTPEIVTLRTQQNTMRGKGMKADLNQNTVELLSSVEVTYAPAR